MNDYQRMIDQLERGAKIFGQCPAGWRERKAADLLRFLGDPREAIAWTEDKGWHRVSEARPTDAESKRG